MQFGLMRLRVREIACRAHRVATRARPYSVHVDNTEPICVIKRYEKMILFDYGGGGVGFAAKDNVIVHAVVGLIR